MIKSWCGDRILCNCENCSNLLIGLRYSHSTGWMYIRLRTKRVSDFVWFCFLFYLGLELSDVKFSPIPSMTVNSISSTAHTQRICTGFAAYSFSVQSLGV